MRIMDGGATSGLWVRYVRTLAAVVRLGRPQFLIGGFVLYALGAAVAWAAGAPRVGARYIDGQIVVTLFQAMTHYANDYFDRDADRANATPTRWSGGSRVLVAGLVPPVVALALAVLLGAAGMLASVGWFSSAPGVLALCVLTGVGAWVYSGPPWPLHSSGFGALAVSAVVCGLVPWLGFAVQTGTARPTLPLGVAIVAPFCLQAAMVLAIDVPDAAGDAAVGKRTFIVRFGLAATRRLYLGLTVAPFLLVPVLIAFVHGPVRSSLLVALAAFPVAALAVSRVARGAFARPAAWPRSAFLAVALFLLTSLLESASLLAATLRRP